MKAAKSAMNNQDVRRTRILIGNPPMKLKRDCFAVELNRYLIYTKLLIGSDCSVVHEF